jgi:hypothetical protein
MRRSHAALFRLSTVVLTTFWTAAAWPADCPIRLHDVTERTGITFRHTDGSSGRYYIVETVSAGLAAFDYDNDGKVDLCFLTGRPLPDESVEGKAADPKQPRPTNALYRNDGGFHFTDVTARAGVGDAGYSLGVAAADYDNDGYQDLYVSNFGRNVLYRNLGNGTFADVTQKAGAGRRPTVGAGVNFLDIDNDGHLDLFVANYLKFSYQAHAIAWVQGVPMYRSPSAYPPERSNLFRNNGNGTFTDVSESSGIAGHAGWGMGSVCADFDNDGNTDIFVANDGSGNFLFHNGGKGKFEQIGLEAGFAFTGEGFAQGSMGVDCGDYDNDGWLDFYQTSYQAQHAVLFRNLGKGLVEDASFRSGAAAGTVSPVTWGSGLVDFDNDGHRDIYVACGHLHDNVERVTDVTTYKVRNVLLRNTGDGKFVNVSDRAGDGMRVCESSRGVVFEDLDNDGRVDVVVLNSRAAPTVLRNESTSGNHWLQLRLRGVRANRDGVGARVSVVAGDLRQIDEVHSGRGYQSHWGTRLHFGLGTHPRADRIEVRWPGGGTDVLKDVAADRQITIVEGSARP